MIARDGLRTNLADELRAWRLGAGLGQNQAARALGVAVVTLRRWESGEQRPQGAARRAVQLVLDRSRECAATT